MGCRAIGGSLWGGETPIGWGEVDDDESIRAIHAALDRGVNFFDPANVFGAGHSERVLGRAIAGLRSQVVIATKFNAVFDEATRQTKGSDASPEGIRKACEDSLLDILTSQGRTVAQGALAWIWARTPQTIPIPGFRTVKQVEENAAAMAFGPLTPEQMRQIEALVRPAA